MRKFMQKFSKSLNFGMEKYVPESYLFAVFLVFVVFLMGIVIAGKGPMDMATYFSDKMWNFLAFSMQMVLMIVTGFVLATTPLGKKVFSAIGRIPKTSVQAVILVSIIACALAYLHWGIGLVGGALLAREIGRNMKKLDFKLLVAATYIGFSLGQVGLSASEVLLVNTPGHFLEKQIGLIPATLTAMSPMCLVPLVITGFIVLPILFWSLHPDEKDTPSVSEETRLHLEQDLEGGGMKNAEEKTFADKVENSPIFNILLALITSVYLVQWFSSNGFNMTLNIFNLLMLTLGILFHWTPKNFYTAFAEGVKISWGIVLQFPIYAGIQGMMASSGLAVTVAGWFISLANTWTFPIWNYIIGALVNLFIPSSGGIWIVLGPIVVKAGQTLGVSNPTIVESFMFGEAFSNIIQPFWAIPILAIAGLKIKDIIGHCIVGFAAISIIFLISMMFITV